MSSFVEYVLISFSFITLLGYFRCVTSSANLLAALSLDDENVCDSVSQSPCCLLPFFSRFFPLVEASDSSVLCASRKKLSLSCGLQLFRFLHMLLGTARLPAPSQLHCVHVLSTIGPIPLVCLFFAIEYMGESGFYGFIALEFFQIQILYFSQKRVEEDDSDVA